MQFIVQIQCIGTFFEFALLSAWKYLFIYLEIFMFFTSFSFQAKQKISDDMDELT